MQNTELFWYQIWDLNYRRYRIRNSLDAELYRSVTETTVSAECRIPQVQNHHLDYRQCRMQNPISAESSQRGSVTTKTTVGAECRIP